MANLLELLQAAQSGQRTPSMLGPIPPQNLQPGFRMPPEMQMQVPRPPDQGDGGLGQGLGMLARGIAGLKGSYDPNGYFNNLGGRPGGYSSIDDLLGSATHVQNPFAADASASSGGLFGFLRGRF